jgi:hypothetical protein
MYRFFATSLLSLAAIGGFADDAAQAVAISEEAESQVVVLGEESSIVASEELAADGGCGCGEKGKGK